MTTALEVELLPHQLEAMTAEEPFVALVTGVGGGKTFTGGWWIASRAAQFPEALHLATANTFPQCRDVVLPAIMATFEAMGRPARLHKQSYTVTTSWGAQILIRSTEVAEELRGLEIASWWGDEIRRATPMQVKILSGRLRAQKCDRARRLWTTTPNGFDFIYHMHVVAAQKERETKGSTRYRLIRAKSTDNPFLPEDYVPTLRDQYDTNFAAQEISGEFVAQGAGTMLRAFSRFRNVRKGRYNPDAPLNLGCDYNVNPMAWCVWQWHPNPKVPGDKRHGEIHVLDEAWVQNGTIGDAAEALRAKWAGHLGGWRLHPDPSAKNRQHGGGTNLADTLTALANRGYRRVTNCIMPSAPLIIDAVNTVNGLFLSDSGISRLFIDPECEHLIDDCEQLVWDKAAKGPDKKDPMRTHAFDGLKYGLVHDFAPSAFQRQDAGMEKVTR